jgi:leucine-rich repeat/coiled-coil domain-containing protein 1
LQRERQTAAAALEGAACAQAEVDRQSRKLVEVEGEMRALLEAVERQKLASVSKMRQLASFLTDLG